MKEEIEYDFAVLETEGGWLITTRRASPISSRRILHYSITEKEELIEFIKALLSGDE